MAKTVPCFGQIVMATRRGWKWSAELRIFVRIKSSPGMHQVEIEPPTFKPDPSPAGADIDWQTQDGVLGMVPALNKYMGRTQPCKFFIDDDGLEIPDPNKNPIISKAEIKAEITVEKLDKPAIYVSPGAAKALEQAGVETAK